MFAYFGPRNWWPGETRFEIIVGAILTQSVAWRNVSKAIENLRAAGILTLEAMYKAPIEEIEKHIVPTLYWRMKAKKLRAFVNHIMDNYHGDLDKFLQKDKEELRRELLSLYGIGPETADSIILYAAEQPVFVVDAYTRRIFHRLGFFEESVSYDEMQQFFMKHIPPDVRYYNEYHALIVGIGNRFCSNKKPDCGNCPIQSVCRFKQRNKVENEG
ncbi:endonuclease III domain-containing protein [Thermincola potens]